MVKIVKQSHEILDLGSTDILQKLEIAGRTCYKSETKITEESARKFVEMILKRGHESVIEHHSISVKFITDRGVTHELVRHRPVSYSQESTRYVNYGGSDIQFILPVEFYNDYDRYDPIDGYFGDASKYIVWLEAMKDSELSYQQMINIKCAPQLARAVLPNSLKTEIVTTCNLREWRHILKLRCSKVAHPQIRALMLPLLDELHTKVPVIFDDLYKEFIGVNDGKN